jgi:hypothetical protein
VTDYVVYHKPEIMGYQAIEVDHLAIYTNKTPSAAAGCRVWLLTGEGTPRVYKLRSTFLVSEVVPSDKPGFTTKIKGKDGQLLEPMPVLNTEPWFRSFRERQGNFAFGFQPVNDPGAEAGLRAVLRASSRL